VNFERMVMTEFTGALRERVILERRLGNRDALGGAVGAYAYDGAAWAAIMPLVPADLTLADSLSATPRWQVTMRKREGVDLRTRLVWRGKYLGVRGLISDPRNPAQMVLTCVEVR
jgi:head-tail adaptor